MRVKAFAAIEDEFYQRVSRDICCNLATIDEQGRLRSRVVHPLWQGPVCWVLTKRIGPKARHIDRHPFVSLAYVGDSAHPAYAECRAEWIEDPDEKQRIWRRFRSSPLGYNPAPFYRDAGHPHLGVLKLKPWRIQIDDSPGETTIWQPG